jgi:hypothetical protein
MRPRPKALLWLAGASGLATKRNRPIWGYQIGRLENFQILPGRGGADILNQLGWDDGWATQSVGRNQAGWDNDWSESVWVPAGVGRRPGNLRMDSYRGGSR